MGIVQAVLDEVSHEHLHPFRPLFACPKRIRCDCRVFLELFSSVLRKRIGALLPITFASRLDIFACSFSGWWWRSRNWFLFRGGRLCCAAVLAPLLVVDSWLQVSALLAESVCRKSSEQAVHCWRFHGRGTPVCVSPVCVCSVVPRLQSVQRCWCW